jgi:hypothetical protein
LLQERLARAGRLALGIQGHEVFVRDPEDSRFGKNLHLDPVAEIFFADERGLAQLGAMTVSPF